MTTNSPHSEQFNSAEQESNGVETGLFTRELADLITSAAQSWIEKDTLPVSLLLALVNLSVAQPERAKEGFTSQDIAEEVGVARKGWASTDDPDAVSDKVRRNWNKLIKEVWESKRVGLGQRAHDIGLTVIPKLDRIEGGGTGRQTRYRIIACPIFQDEYLGEPKSSPLGANEIRYISEDMNDSGLFMRAFATGFEISGWRRWTLLMLLLTVLLVGFAPILLIFLGIMAQMRFKNWLYLFFSTCLLLFGLWSTFSPIFRLSTSRILFAPWWMQSIKDDRLLLWQCPPKYPIKKIKVARYSGVCLLCGGKVTVKSGGLEFFGRLIGRCEESPQEHIFTFDHILRVGRLITRA